MHLEQLNTKSLCEKAIKTTDYGQIRTLRLFKDILEACFEVTANHPEAAAGLWNWAKGAAENTTVRLVRESIYKGDCGGESYI